MRTAARVDENHKRIVKAFRDFGFQVLDISRLKNCADLIVSKRGESVIVEIKSPLAASADQRLTDGEAKFRDKWQGLWSLVMTLDDVEAIDRRIDEKNRRWAR